MLVYEMKLEGEKVQYERLDEAIRTGRFVRNSILKAWMDGEIKSRNDAYKYSKVLADNPEFPWTKKLNSMARQAHAERAWAAIERFYKNCKAKVPGKKGYPKFKKYQVRASVEYKTSGWKLSEDRRYLKLTDKLESGTFKLWGSRDLHYYQLQQIKRVRIIRRHDGPGCRLLRSKSYRRPSVRNAARFLIDHTREEKKLIHRKTNRVRCRFKPFLHRFRMSESR
jgi:putative transposase